MPALPAFTEIAALSPWLVALYLLFVFAERVLVPLFIKHVWPHWSKAARERQARAAKEAEQRAADEREAEEERRRREDRLFQALEGNSRVMTELQVTLKAMSAQFTGQLERQSEAIHALALDVSGLYGHLQVPRPSRGKPAAKSAGGN